MFSSVSMKEHDKLGRSLVIISAQPHGCVETSIANIQMFPDVSLGRTPFSDWDLWILSLFSQCLSQPNPLKTLTDSIKAK